MENTKRQNWFINFIKAFTSADISDDGRVSEANLTSEERKILADIRNMDKVENIEANIRSKYAAKINSGKAKIAAATKGKTRDSAEEKTIGSKE